RGGGHYANLTKLQTHANNKATDNTININYEAKQKYRLGTVSNLITGGLNRFDLDKKPTHVDSRIAEQP
ncbi:MAG: hypothetical protein AB2693_17590, partial [Candidatus Thiodiazotropha sp.]